MKYQSIFKLSIATLILSSVTLANAYARQEAVSCPSADLIKNSWPRLDTVQMRDTLGNYFVYADFDSIYDQGSLSWWQLHSADVNATDFNSAFNVAVNNVKSVTTVRDASVAEADGFYTCIYLNNTGLPVAYAVANTHEQNANLKKMGFKLKG